MAGTYTTLTTITSCDTTAGFTPNLGSLVVGSNAPEGNNFVYQNSPSVQGSHHLAYLFSPAQDFSNGDYFWLWSYPYQPYRATDKDDVNPGVQVRFRDGSSNDSIWNILGRDTSAADAQNEGFTRLCIDPAAAPDDAVGSLDISNIIQFWHSMYFATSTGGLTNMVDHLAVGRGITCTGGGSVATPLDMDDLAGESLTLGYQITKVQGSVYDQLGDIKFDSTVSDIHFTESGKTISWIERRGALDKERGIYSVGNPPRLEIGESGANETHVIFGDPVSELNGCSLVREIARPVLKINGPITELKFLGTFFPSWDFDFSAGADPEMKNVSLDNCGEFPVLDNPFQNCVVSNADSGILMAASHVVEGGLFTNCVDAVHVSENGPLTIQLSGMTFLNNTTDIHFSGSGTLNIENRNGSDASTSRVSGGGTVIIRTLAEITITAVDNVSRDPVSLVGAEIRIYDLDSAQPGHFGTELAGVESNPTSNYVYTGDYQNDILVQILLSGYVELTREYQIPNLDAELNLILIRETND